MTRTGRNDLCWCGSGKKFKNCHLRRSEEQPRPMRAIMNEVRQEAAFRTCLHPDASQTTCGKVVSAHTLQRSRVLAAIADEENHVLTFYPFEFADNEQLRVHRRGWKRASVFEAFCDRHDGQAFSPLEATAFTGTKEQVFLIAYRAICWELYQKQRAIRASPTVRRLADRGMPEYQQRRLQNALAAQDAGFAKGFAEASDLKARMDVAFLAQDFNVVECLEFTLDGELSIASTGAITPNRTIGGRHLQTLHRDTIPMEWLAFATDLRHAQPSIVFTWLQGQAAPQRYLEEVVTLSPAARATFLAQFFFAHCENTYFSGRWWNTLSEAHQHHIQVLTRNSNPYYFPPAYDLDAQELSPWQAANPV